MFFDVRRAEHLEGYRIRLWFEHGTLVWGDGEVDIAPETLYELATGKTVDFPS